MNPPRAQVSGRPPDGRQLVAPERAVGSGRVARLDRDDKHRRPEPDDTGSRVRSVRRATRPRWLAPVVGAGVAVGLLVAVAVALAGGGDAEEAETIVAGGVPTSVGGAQAPTPTASGAGAATTVVGAPGPVAVTPVAPTTTGRRVDLVEGFAGTWSVTRSNVRLGGTTGIYAGSTLSAIDDDTWYVRTPEGTTNASGQLFTGASFPVRPTQTGDITCSFAGCQMYLFSETGAEVTPTGFRFTLHDGAPTGTLPDCGLVPAGVGDIVVDAQDAATSPPRIDAFHFVDALGVEDGDGCAGGGFVVLFDVIATRVA